MPQVQALRCLTPSFRIRFRERWRSRPAAAGLAPLPPGTRTPSRRPAGSVGLWRRKAPCVLPELCDGAPKIPAEPQHTSQEKAQPHSVPGEGARSPGLWPSPTSDARAGSAGSARCRPAAGRCLSGPHPSLCLPAPHVSPLNPGASVFCTSFNLSLLPGSMRPLSCVLLRWGHRLPNYPDTHTGRGNTRPGCRASLGG